MVIRRSNSNTLSVENSQDKSIISVKSLDGQLVLKVQSGSEEIEISKPGDYEYFEDGITAFELPIEKYIGLIHLIKLNVECIKIVIATNIREISKEVLSNLANIDILVVPLVNANAAKQIASAIEPKKIVIVKSFNMAEEVELDSVKKALGIANMEEVTSVKHKPLDFASSSEETTLIGEILA